MTKASLLLFFFLFVVQSAEARRAEKFQICLNNLVYVTYENSGWVKWDPEFTLHAYAVVLERFPEITFTEMQKDLSKKVGALLKKEFNINAEGASLIKQIRKYFGTPAEAKRTLRARGILPVGVEIQDGKLPKGYLSGETLDHALKLLEGKVDFKQSTMFEMEKGDPRLKEVADYLGIQVSGKSMYRAVEREESWKDRLDKLDIDFNQYNRIWSRDRILALITDLKENGITLNLTRLRRLYPLGIPGSEKIFGRTVTPNALRKYIPKFFDDWWSAVEEAGYSRLEYQIWTKGYWKDRKNIRAVLRELKGSVDLHASRFVYLDPNDPSLVKASAKRGFRVTPLAIYRGARRAYKRGWGGALRAEGINLPPLLSKTSQKVKDALISQILLAGMSRNQIPELIYFIERFGYPATPESFRAHSRNIANVLYVEYGISMFGKNLLRLAELEYGGLLKALNSIGIRQRKRLKDKNSLELNAYNFPVFLQALSSNGIKWENRETFSKQNKKTAKLLKALFGDVDVDRLYRNIPYYLGGYFERPTREALTPEEGQKIEKRQVVYSNMDVYRERDESSKGDKLTYSNYVSVSAPIKETSLAVEDDDLYETLDESVSSMDDKDQAIVDGILAYLEQNESLDNMTEVTEYLKKSVHLNVTEVEVRSAYQRLAKKFAQSQTDDSELDGD